MMSKKIISTLISACLLVGVMPISTLAASVPAPVDLIHSSGNTLRDGIGVSSFRVTNSGTKEAPERNEIKDNYNKSYGDLYSPFDESISYNINECIVDYAYEVHYQIDLGASRNISQIIYTVQSRSDTALRDDDKEKIKIELSNDPEFKDSASDPLDVYLAYIEGDVAKPKNIHTVNLSGIPSYRYIRLSAIDNRFMEGERRQLCIAEFEVYGYIDGYVDLTADATATQSDGAAEFNLNSLCSLDNVQLSASNVTVYGKANLADEYVQLAIGSKSVSIPEDAGYYQYIKVSPGSGTVSTNSVKIYGYNLFDEVAYLDITDDGSTVYAKAKYGDENTLILAEFNSHGRCMQIKSAKATEIITMPVVEGHTYKAFLWKSLKERIPVTKSIKLEK